VDLTPALEATPTGERPRVDRAERRLVGSRCEDCRAVSWPMRAVCHGCGSADCVEVGLAREGSLLTFTTVWVPRPGLEPPYVLGQVKLPEGVRVFAHARGLTADHRVPLPVRLVLAEDEDAVPPFWFEPLEDR